MPICVPADDAFLVKFWPGVVVRLPERWLVAVDGPLAQTGAYGVTMQSLPYEYAATVPPDDAPAIRDGLLAALGGQMTATASPQGLSSIILAEVSQPGVVPPGLGITVSGPAVNTISATLLPGGGDMNADLRADWLEATLCCLPSCSRFCSCPGDYTRMHAALTAALLYLTNPANMGTTGAGANDFDRMRLGPAELEKAKGAWQSALSVSDADIATTVPGRYFLRLRAKYVFPILCVGGPC